MSQHDHRLLYDAGALLTRETQVIEDILSVLPQLDNEASRARLLALLQRHISYHAALVQSKQTRTPVVASEFDITVNSLGQQPMVLTDVTGAFTVFEVCRRIRCRTELPILMQTLVYNGVHLAYDKDLSDYGIDGHSELYLILNL